MEVGDGLEVGSACNIGYGVVLSFSVYEVGEVGGGGGCAAGLEGWDDLRMGLMGFTGLLTCPWVSGSLLSLNSDCNGQCQIQTIS
jgi:hypothetical protein